MQGISPIRAVGLVPKRHVDSVCVSVPKRHTLGADFFDFETETGKNVHQCPSQNPTTRSDKYGYPQP
jgi:hypothetical protein